MDLCADGEELHSRDIEHSSPFACAGLGASEAGRIRKAVEQDVSPSLAPITDEHLQSASSLPQHPQLSGAFEPERDDHFVYPNGGYYAGSRPDFPLPACRYPLPRGTQLHLREPEPGTPGGRQRHYLDDPEFHVRGFYTEAGDWIDWPPRDYLPAATDADAESDSDDTMADVESSAADESFSQADAQDEQPTHSMTVSATVGTRRQANGTIGSVYSGNKIRHLKKEDGIPLWRKDIQYQFLKLVFEDKTPVFTRLSDGRKGMDFADIYIDAMAKSSKTSKILKDKLQNDKQAAISMAMVCLLVNFGRMNTTLNCALPPSAIALLPLQQRKADQSSLPGDARPATDLPLDPLPAGAPGPQCLQAASGCPAPEVDPQGRVRGYGPAEHDREDQASTCASHESRQPYFRPVAVRTQDLRDALFPAARLLRPRHARHA